MLRFTRRAAPRNRSKEGAAVTFCALPCVFYNERHHNAEPDSILYRSLDGGGLFGAILIANTNDLVLPHHSGGLEQLHRLGGLPRPL